MVKIMREKSRKCNVSNSIVVFFIVPTQVNRLGSVSTLLDSASEA
jgi:hypothetical protein